MGQMPLASNFGCLTPQGMFVEGPPGPEGPAVSVFCYFVSCRSLVRTFPAGTFIARLGLSRSTLRSFQSKLQIPALLLWRPLLSHVPPSVCWSHLTFLLLFLRD